MNENKSCHIPEAFFKDGSLFLASTVKVQWTEHIGILTWMPSLQTEHKTQKQNNK